MEDVDPLGSLLQVLSEQTPLLDCLQQTLLAGLPPSPRISRLRRSCIICSESRGYETKHSPPECTVR